MKSIKYIHYNESIINVIMKLFDTGIENQITSEFLFSATKLLLLYIV